MNRLQPEPETGGWGVGVGGVREGGSERRGAWEIVRRGVMQRGLGRDVREDGGVIEDEGVKRGIEPPLESRGESRIGLHSPLSYLTFSFILLFLVDILLYLTFSILLLKFLTLPLIVLGCLRVVPTPSDFIWRK
jgi:hypothetical protein